MKENNEQEKFEPAGTKINPAMAVVWNAVCDALGTDTYHLLQNFIYAMIRMASDAHARTPEVEKLMTILDNDGAWNNAINLCAPNGRQSISQIILIVEQEDKEGFGMYMVNKPFIGQCMHTTKDGDEVPFNKERMQECIQTENVNLILERVLEVGFKRIYNKIRDLGARHECKWFADIILLMLDAQDMLEIEESERQEMIGQAEFNDYGQRIAYGKKTKGFKHRTPDSLDRQHRILFDDFDRQTGDDFDDGDGRDGGQKVEDAMGCKPFGEEP